MRRHGGRGGGRSGGGGRGAGFQRGSGGRGGRGRAGIGAGGASAAPSAGQALRKRSRFDELLEGGGGGRGAGAADEAAIAALGKRLKVKGGRMADEGDGLGGFLAGLGGESGGESGGSDGEGSVFGDDSDDAEDYDEDSDDFGSGDAVGVGDYDDGDEDEEADLGVGDSDSDDSDGLVSDASEDAEDSEGFGSDEFEGAGDYDDGDEEEEANFGAGGSEEGEESDSGAEDGQEPVAAREPAVAKFVPRRVREQQQRAAAGSGVAEDAELAKEIRRLLNRVTEAQLKPLAQRAAALCRTHGGAAVATLAAPAAVQIVGLTPKVSETIAATLAAYLSAASALAGGAELTARAAALAAKRLEAAVTAGNERETCNLTLLLAAMHLCGALGHASLLGLVARLADDMNEAAAAALHALFRTAGGSLRAADRVGFRDAMLALQEGVARAARRSGGGGSTRLDLMLQTALSAKNGHAAVGGGGELAAVVARQRAFLHSAGVAKIVVSCGWDELLDERPAGSGDVEARKSRRPAAEQASARAGSGSGKGGGTDLFALAQSARMNTGTRRAVFCCVMGAADAADAADKLTALRLPTSQQREVQGVVLECCLRERGFNRYYAHLAATLAARERVHGVALRTILWDRFRSLPNAQPEELVNLGAFTAHVMARTAAPPTLLCPVGDHFRAHSTKVDVVLRAMLSTLLLSRYGAEQVAFWDTLASSRELEDVKGLMTLSLRKALAAKGKAGVNGSDADRAFCKKGRRLLLVLRGGE